MQLLCQRIKEEGKHLGGGILKVDSFMNHQIDPALMQAIGLEFARRFAGCQANKILTCETSGIAPALASAMALKIPLVFARKHQPITMGHDPYRQKTTSPTHGNTVEIMVSNEYLSPGDRVLILDDFLASAKTILALVGLVQASGATLVGIGAVIEKAFASGRKALEPLSVPIEALATIERFEGDQIVMREQN